MRTSIPARFERASERGFTLVELMVVVAIIGFVSAAVILAMPDPRGRVMDDAEHFAARLLAARDNAIVQGRPMRVWVSASGYGFDRRSDGRWLQLDDTPFVTTNWREGTAARIGAAGVDIAFDSTGLPADALSVVLMREGERVAVSVDMGGKVAVGE